MALRVLDKTDIRFEDPRLARLMVHINRLTEEMQRIQELLSEGTPGQVLVKRSERDFDGGWADAGGGSGGGGEANTGANQGDGAGVFRDKSGVTLNFRSLTGGAGIEIVVDGDEIRISATESADHVEPMMIAGVFA